MIKECLEKTQKSKLKFDFSKSDLNFSKGSMFRIKVERKTHIETLNKTIQNSRATEIH